MSSPAERYAAAKRRQAADYLPTFEASLPFGLDDFQREGCEAVERGHSVLVAAPTGAGKTVVGEFAVAHALRRGMKAFYTTPIKALSNQKFRDLTAEYGPGTVGLLTGDTTVNPDADVIVMTTEVLRNMIYAGSSSLDRLAVVVLDEVHYLADRERGSVWEEVIVHLGAATSIVALSATVSNVEEFGAWLTEVRGDTEVVVSERRPVPLWPHVLVREGMFDLYAPEVDPRSIGPKARLNPELEALAKRIRREDEAHGHPNRMRYGKGGHQRRSSGGRRPPPRFAVVEVLDEAALLPAIVFVFSRAGCEDAVDQVMAAGIRLTTEAERDEIEETVDAACAAVPAADLALLGFDRFKAHLAAGIAAHHAGLIPLFKEVVEQLFSAGLVKVVYATETLALGINMPARSVVLEKLVKWDGEGHKDLTAGEYTQLTGRAGRRGIDVEGHAIVVEHRGFDAAALARLASKRTYPLISSFQPSYNMAVNLVATAGPDRARELLELSFAQFQADRSVVGQAAKVREIDGVLAGYREAAQCDRGDFMVYAGLRERLGRSQKEAAQRSKRARREATAATLAGLERGQVVRIGAGKHTGLAVIVEPDADPLAPRPHAVTAKGRSARLAVADLHRGLEVVGTVKVPRKFNVRDAQWRKTLGAMAADYRPVEGGAAPAAVEGDDSASPVAGLRAEIERHPCHACPERETHARWAERYFRTLRDKDRLTGQISRATGSIARVFDRRCDVLEQLGYLDRSTPDWRVTQSGEMLRWVFAETDLVIGECLRRGVWDGLGAPHLAAVVSTLIYGGRRDDEDATPFVPGGPQGPLRAAMDDTVRVWSELDDLHRAHRLPDMTSPQWAMVRPVFAWAQGRTLDEAIGKMDVAPGDMVRLCKQVIDALDQISQVAPSAPLRAAARKAITSMRRGVVAY